MPRGWGARPREAMPADCCARALEARSQSRSRRVMNCLRSAASRIPEPVQKRTGAAWPRFAIRARRHACCVFRQTPRHGGRYGDFKFSKSCGAGLRSNDTRTAVLTLTHRPSMDRRKGGGYTGYPNEAKLHQLGRPVGHQSRRLTSEVRFGASGTNGDDGQR